MWEDRAGVLEVAEALAMFPPEGLEMIGGLLAGHFEAGEEAEAVWLSAEAAGRVVGVAYCKAEAMAEGVWNLLFLGVHPACQRGGVGTALVEAVRREVAGRGARLLIVETSGTARYEPARRFYRRAGFELEGKVRDYYTDGDDKLTFATRVRTRA